MYVSEIELFDALRAHTSEPQARAIVAYVSAKVEAKFYEARDVLATKEDLQKLRVETKQEIGLLRAEMKEEIGLLRAEFKEEIGQLCAEMKEEKFALLKWMIALFIGQMAGIAGLLTLLR